MPPAAKSSAPSGRARAPKDANLLVRLDTRAKSIVQRAASSRGLSVSDYVRSGIVPLARRDLEEATTGVLRLNRDDQIAFWKALHEPRKLTAAQKALGRLVRSVR
jgi:uncharacterized protein (DUF1778 family)